MLMKPDGSGGRPRRQARRDPATARAPLWWLAAVALIAWSATTVSAVAAGRAFLSNPDIPPAARTDPATLGVLTALRQSAKKTGSARLIIGLRVAFAPEKNLNAAEIAQQRGEIAAAQDGVVRSIPSLRPERVRRFATIPFMAVAAAPAELEALITRPEVTSIEEDKLAQPLLAESVPLIGGTAAWDRGYSGLGQTVAILDTGVDGSHPFLAGKVVSEACYSSNYAPDSASSICPGGVTASTATGSAMPYAGTCPTAECDHGTHVAGIAAGKGASFSGVAKDATLVAIQIFSRVDDAVLCGATSPCVLAYESDEIRGLEQVYALRDAFHIDAVNLSLGGGRYFDQATCDADNAALKTAIDNLRAAGIVTVAAAGNNGYTDSLSAPGCISTAVSVGATWDTAGWLNNCSGYTLGSSAPDAVACYSNSAAFLNLLAPGSAITSSIPGGGYAEWHGTSMATPHVTGSWAVLRQKKADLAVSDALGILTSTGVPVADPRNALTKPRIKLDSALDAITSNCNASLGPTGLAAGATASLGSVTVTADAACGWSAVSNVGWITLTAGTSGTGNGSVDYYVDANGGATARTGTVAIDGLSFTVTQQGSGDTTPPTIPTGLAAVAVSSSQIDLSWTASTDATGVSNYKLYRDGVQIAQIAATYYSDTGLAASTGYNYTVAACDAAANCSSPSASASATTLGLTVPDLILTALNTATAALAPGQTLYLSNTVKNQGTAPAGAFSVDFHLSANAVYGDGDDIALTAVRSVSGLAAGTSSAASTKLAVPLNVPAGGYFLCAMADSTNAVYEGAGEGNNSRCTAAPVTVTFPNLAVTAVTPASTSTSQGASLTVNSTVMNLGPVGSGSSKTGFRLSLNRVFGDADDIVIAGTQSVSTLSAGTAKSFSTSVKVPLTTPPNSYYLCAAADATDLVAELDETDNTLCSSTQVTVPPPDLVLSALSTSATAVAPGQSLKLSNTAKNQGGSKAGAFTIGFRLSVNALYGDGDDIALTAVRNLSSLSAGASSAATTTVTIPAATPLGHYYLCAMADSGNTVSEGAEDNNTRCTAGAITVDYSDLVMTDVAPTVATVNQGASMAVNSTVLNQGVAGSGSSKIGFWLSPNNVFGDGDDIAISTLQSVSALAAGTSQSFATTVKVPSTAAAGRYYLCAKADATNLVPELDESNNALCSTLQVTVPPPDLVISSLSVTPATVAPGTSISVSNAITNQGGAKAAAFAVAFHLSANTIYGDGDDVASASTRNLSSLAVGATSSASTTVKIPAAVAPGTYYLCARADDAGTVSESDETNNTACTANVITIP